MPWTGRPGPSACRAREVETIRARLTTTLGRPPGNHELADALGISTRELDDVHADLARASVLSLQGLVTYGLADTPANHAECPESLILYRERMGYLHDAIAALPQRLRFVVVAHFFEQRQMRISPSIFPSPNPGYRRCAPRQ